MTDDELMALIRAAFEASEPVPGFVLEDARAAFRWRVPPEVEAVLARLISDTEVRDPALRGSGSRLLSFGDAELEVEIEVTGTGRTREIAGQLTPGGPAEVRVRHAAGELASHTDRMGQFVVLNVPEGLVSLTFRLPDGSSIVTSWVRL